MYCTNVCEVSGVDDNKKKCDPCQLGKEKGNCSDTMTKLEKENNYSRVNETIPTAITVTVIVFTIPI